MVSDQPEKILTQIEIYDDPYSAASGSHALVICTEWDEFIVSFHLNNQNNTLLLLPYKIISLLYFQTLDYQKIYDTMLKPAFLFDGRKIVDHEKVLRIGFHVETIGKRVTRSPLLRGWAAVTQST